MNQFKSYFRLCALLLSLSFFGCGSEKQSEEQSTDESMNMEEQVQEETSIKISGSDTLSALAASIAQEYMKVNTHASINVSGGGTGTGFAELIQGNTHIVNASRGINDKEKLSIEEHGAQAKEWEIAKEGVSVYVHKNNPISTLSLGQLKDIFTGKISNWKEVGGKDAPIVTYGRDSNSGTYQFFKEKVLDTDEFMTGVQAIPGVSALLRAVENDENGIGYSSGNATKDNLKECKLKMKVNSEAYAPTKDAVSSGKYPLVRGLYVYTTSKNMDENPEIQKYIDFILSEKGQALIVASGYHPIAA